jgi:signal transduction histidine kinase
MRRMGGDLTLDETPPGTGARFRVTLPTVTDDPAP